MMWTRAAAALALTAFAPAVMAPAQPPADAAPARYAMPGTHMWDMTSDKGEVYRIFVSYPTTEEAPKQGYPVLYVLDGNANFASFAETRRAQEYYDVGKSIIVGVGYPGDLAYDHRRLNDLTPPLVTKTGRWAELAKYPSGGQDAFHDSLTGKLRREIARRYQVDAERQSLFGHSLGGLFALHTLFTRPQAFYAIAAASPSVEWNEQGLLKEERAFAAAMTDGRIGKTSRLLVTVGGRDVDDDPHVGEALARRMELLSGYGLRSRFRRYEDEGHMTVPTRSVPDVLRFVSEGF